MNPPRVALAGFYGRGNFGDDLAAVLFGLFLKRIRVPVRVYKLCASLSGEFGLEAARTADELLDDAQLLVWGGGGLLAPWADRTYGLLYPGVAEEYDSLIGAALRRGVPLSALSVGGTGAYPSPLTPRYKQRLLESATYVSVRNPQDLALLARHRVAGDYFPDVVWQTATQFPAERTRSDRRRIGIDVYPSNLLRQKALHLAAWLQLIVWKRRDCEFVLLDTTNARVKAYRGLGVLVRGRNARTYQFHDLRQDLQVLASLDLMVTTRLHAWMACVGYGVPAISLAGEKKTTLLLENLRMEDACFGRGRSGRFLRLMLSKDRLERFLRDFPFPDVARLRAESDGHFRRLSELLETLGRRVPPWPGKCR